MSGASPLLMLALSYDLTERQQEIIAGLADGSSAAARARTALASRPDLGEGAAEKLLGAGDSTVRVRVLKNVSGRQHMQPRSVREEAAVASNLAAEADTLARYAQHRSAEVRLRALCNPSTSEDIRRAALKDAGDNLKLVERRSPLGAQVVRAGALTANNRWLLERASEESSPIRRGLTCLPEAPLDLLTASTRWNSARWHPRRQGRDIHAMSASELAASPSGAAHTEMLDRQETGPAHAAQVLCGRNVTTSGGRLSVIHPEPHIIARALDRYGTAALASTEKLPMMAGTRRTTAGWASPYAQEILDAMSGTASPETLVSDSTQALGMLGEDIDAWRIFIRLTGRSHRHHGMMVEAAEIACM